MNNHSSIDKVTHELGDDGRITLGLCVAIRHGRFSVGEECLNDDGYAQAAIASRLLQRLLPREDIYIAATSGPRSRETARLIAGQLDIDSVQLLQEGCIDFLSTFLSDNKSRGGLILVTNGKELRHLAHAMADLYRLDNPVRRQIRRGPMHALIIDAREKNVDQIVIP